MTDIDLSHRPAAGATAARASRDDICAAAAEIRRRSGMPGLSIAVARADGVVLAAGYGLVDLAAHRPATASSRYPWFSMTKVVTTTAALRLADEGRLDLDAPVGDYVDFLAAPRGPQPRVRQLLSHTAGLANPLPLRWVHPADGPPPDPELLLRRLMGRRRAYRYPVGQAARYSNVGYLAVGQIIAAVAGEPFEDYVTRSVLQPAGMRQTVFRCSTNSDLATGYVRAPRLADPLLRRLLPGGIAGDRRGPDLALNPFAVDGPAYGGLVGQVLDAARFLRLHLNDGELDGQRVLAARTARLMRRIDHPGKPFDHGLGWFRRPASSTEEWVEHLGAGVGFWNAMRLYPQRGVGVVVMSNGTRPYDVEPLFSAVVDTWSR